MNNLCLLCIFQSKVKIPHTSFCDTRDTIRKTHFCVCFISACVCVRACVHACVRACMRACVFSKDQSARSNLASGQHSPLMKNRQRKRKGVRVKKKVRKVTGGNNRQRERGGKTQSNTVSHTDTDTRV